MNHLKGEAQSLEQQPRQQQQQQQHKTQGRWQAAVRSALLSEHFQSAMQISAGMFVACLFSFVRAIHFGPQSCVVSTLFLVAAVMSSPNNHLGSRVIAAASMVGSLLVGVTAACIVGSVAKAAGQAGGLPAMTGVSCGLGVAVLALLAINRVGTAPPMLWALGMQSCLAFGLTSITAWRVTTVTEVWATGGVLMLAAAIAAVVAMLAAGLVLPTLASEQVQDAVAGVLRSAGTASSHYAARLFRPLQQDGAADAQAEKSSGTSAAAAAAAVGENGTANVASQGAAAASGYSVSPDEDEELTSLARAASQLEAVYEADALAPPAAAAAAADNEVDDDAWLALIQRNSEPRPAGGPAPSHPSGYRCPLPQPQVSSLRPKLAQASLLLGAAAAEPQWARGFGLGWSSNAGLWFEPAAWERVIRSLLLLLTRLSALEAVVEDGLSLHDSAYAMSPQLQSRLRLVYSQASTSLALMAAAAGGYGRQAKQQQQQGRQAGKDVEHGGGDAASGPFCGCVGMFGCSWAEAKEELAQFMLEDTQRYWRSVLHAPPGSPSVVPQLTQVRHMMFTWSLTNGIIDALADLEAAAAAALCHGPPASLAQRLLSWTRPLLPLLGAVHLARNWVAVLGRALPAALQQGSEGITTMLSNPRFPAGAKYWLVLSLVLCATLLFLHFDPALISLNPAFGYVAASLAMSERVEATVSKVAFYAAGTISGGALGYLVMLHPASATNPVILMAVMVGAAGLVGLATPTAARVGITLTLMTLSALVLCQCCTAPGRAEVAATRVVAVLAGVLTSAFVANYILPWYTSDWALDVLAHTYMRATALLHQMLARTYRDGADAVARYEAACVPPLKSSAAVQLGGGATAQQNAGGSSQQQQQGSAATMCITYSAAEVAAAAAVADAVQEAVNESFPFAGLCSSSSSSAVDVCSPAVLQQLIAQPLIGVQVSLMKDTVAWKRGVLATPPVVPQLLGVLLSLLDRLAGMQLAMAPPCISGRFTGVHHLHYGVPAREGQVALTELAGLLAAAVSAVLAAPSPQHVHMVKMLIRQIERQRMALYKQTRQMRLDMHAMVRQQHAALAGEQQQQQQQQQQGAEAGGQLQPDAAKRLMLMLSTVDDVVRFRGFQFAQIKCLDTAVAAAKVAIAQGCRGRNTTRCTLK